MFNQHYINIFDDVPNSNVNDVDTDYIKNEVHFKGTDSSYMINQNGYQIDCSNNIIDDHIEYMDDNYIMDHFSTSTESVSMDNIDSPQCMDYNNYSPNHSSTPSSPDSSLTSYTSQSSHFSQFTSTSPNSLENLSHLSQPSLDSHSNHTSSLDETSHHFISEEESLSKPASYFLYSQFKQDQLQEIIKQQQEKKMTKEPTMKIKTDPIIKSSENMKMTPQYVISEIPYSNDSRNGMQQNFISNQLGHVAIATIAQNNFPMVQGGNAIIAIHPVQTLYPFSSSQLSNLLSSSHMSSDFKYFDGIKSKKRCRMSSSSFEKERRVRPKVIPEKGAIQCKGYNRKKKTQCKNAALMEFIGPRPHYCAEHIDLDPECLYTKCKSPYNKTKEDEKGCREVVLKEFSFCHKHYYLSIEEMGSKGEEGRKEAEEKLERAKDLLKNLEEEAIKAKRSDPDLFQRKHKLIPKFQQVIRTLQKFLQTN